MASVTVPGFTFAEQLVLNLAGPLLTALVVGIGVAVLTRRAQNRRDSQIRDSDLRRADQLLEIERHREDHALRERLISQAIEAPSGLYLATQHYWRAKQDGLTGDDLAPHRDALDRQYLASRQQGMVLEHLLHLHFRDPRPRRLCHRLMDLLTIRYFQLVRDGGASATLRRQNEGEEHTGLSAADLASAPQVLAKYHATIGELVEALAHDAFDRVGTPEAAEPSSRASPT